MDDDFVGEAAAQPVAAAAEKMTAVEKQPLERPVPPPAPPLSATRTPRQAKAAAAATAAAVGASSCSPPPQSPPSAAVTGANGGATITTSRRKSRKPNKKDAAALMDDDGELLQDGGGDLDGSGAPAPEDTAIRAVAVYGDIPGKGGLVAASVPVLCGTLLELHLHQRTLLDALFDTVDQMFFAPLPPGGVDEMYFEWLLAQAPPHLSVSKKGGGPLRYADFATNRARGEASSLRRTMCIALKKVKPFDAIEVIAHSELQRVSALRSGQTPPDCDPTELIHSLFEIEPPISLPVDAVLPNPPPQQASPVRQGDQEEAAPPQSTMPAATPAPSFDASATPTEPPTSAAEPITAEKPVPASPVKEEPMEDVGGRAAVAGSALSEGFPLPAEIQPPTVAATAAAAPLTAPMKPEEQVAFVVPPKAEPNHGLLKMEDAFRELLSSPTGAAPPMPPPAAAPAPRVTRSQIKRSSPAAPSSELPNAPPKKTRKNAAAALHSIELSTADPTTTTAPAMVAAEPVKQTTTIEELSPSLDPLSLDQQSLDRPSLNPAVATKAAETNSQGQNDSGAEISPLEIVETPVGPPPQTPQEEVFLRWMKKEAKAVMRRRVEESADLSPEQKVKKLEEIKQSEFPYIKRDLGKFARLDYLCSPAVEFSVPTNWTPREIAIFQVALCTYGQDFAEISNCIRSKSYKETYLFYTLAFKQSSRYASFKFHKKIAAWYALT